MYLNKSIELTLISHLYRNRSIELTLLSYLAPCSTLSQDDLQYLNKSIEFTFLWCLWASYKPPVRRWLISLAFNFILFIYFFSRPSQHFMWKTEHRVQIMLTWTLTWIRMEWKSWGFESSPRWEPWTRCSIFCSCRSRCRNEGTRRNPPAGLL